MKQLNNIIELSNAITKHEDNIKQLENFKNEILQELEKIEHQIRIENLHIKVKKATILKRVKEINEAS